MLGLLFSITLYVMESGVNAGGFEAKADVWNSHNNKQTAFIKFYTSILHME